MVVRHYLMALFWLRSSCVGINYIGALRWDVERPRKRSTAEQWNEFLEQWNKFMIKSAPRKDTSR